MTVQLACHTLHLRREIASATRGNVLRQQRLYVRFAIGNDTVGYGESAPHPKRRPSLENIKQEVSQRIRQESTREWCSKWESLPLCLQMAVIDAMAKTNGMPAWQFLALPEPPKHPGTLVTFGGTPEQIRQQVATENPESVKLKLLGDDEDRSRLRALTGVFAGQIAIDLNGAWGNWHEAATNLQRLPDWVPDDCEILWVEQPCPPREMRARLPTEIPIFADEAVTEPSFEWAHYDGIVVKPAARSASIPPPVRGLAACIRLAKEAHKRGLLVTLGCHLQSSLLTSASLQLAGLATAARLDLDSALLVDNDPFSPPCADPITGQLNVTATEGFGKFPCELNWQTVK